MALLSALATSVNNPDRKAAGTSKDLRGLFDCMWTFARYPGVGPTNNLAERRIRPAVPSRKGNFGTQSERGGRFVERMLTVVATLKLPGRSVLDFIEQAIRAGRTGTTAPRLLPE